MWFHSDDRSAERLASLTAPTLLTGAQQEGPQGKPTASLWVEEENRGCKAVYGGGGCESSSYPMGVSEHFTSGHGQARDGPEHAWESKTAAVEKSSPALADQITRMQHRSSRKADKQNLPVFPADQRHGRT